MARGQNTAGHPNRQVHRDRFGIGDVVHVPGHGQVTVGSVGKRYFSGSKESGEALGKTGIGLARGEGMYGDATPWKIDKR